MVSETTVANTPLPPTSQEQQSGMAPMGIPPQDGPSSRGDAPPNHPGAPLPHGGGGPPSGFAPQGPYQAAQQPYPPPPPGNFPYGYPGPLYSSGGPPGPYGSRPPFFGGFPPGAFPQQHASRHGGDKLGKPQEKTSPPSLHNNHLNKTDRPTPASHPVVGGPVSLSSIRTHSTKTPLEMEMERQQAAASDFTSSVQPMRSAFYFFVNDMKERLTSVALEEVKKSIPKGQGVDVMLLNTNLNSRLIKEWEDADVKVREKYMEKEEEDRKRFMADDEIASRHCATLTARARSPKFGNLAPNIMVNNTTTMTRVKMEDNGNTQSFASATAKEEKRDASPTENGEESPTKKSRTEDQKE